jgi:signal transduction histidine kinase
MAPLASTNPSKPPRPFAGPRPAPRRAARAHLSSDAPVAATFFRDMVGSMRNGVIAITRDGRLASINTEAYRILGLRPSPNDAGRLVAEALQDAPEIVRILLSAFELTQLPNRAELRLRHTPRVIGYTLSQVRDPRGEVTGAALFFKDLTRVEQIEERERLRDRLAALGEMAAAIAHEVKNPLAGIEVMAGLLKRRVPDRSDAQALLNDIINEAKMANAIVLEVLEFVRPIRLQVEPVELARVVDDAVRAAESLVTRGEVRLRLEIPGDLPPVEADAHQLRQLFTNLLTNAFEALSGSGAVHVAAQYHPPDDSVEAAGAGVVEIAVADTGPGVPVEVRDRIFSPFFTTKPRGSGLGLAIVRKIVDAHEGKIDLEVGSERGTTFRVRLPVEPCREEEERYVPPAAGPARTSGNGRGGTTAADGAGRTRGGEPGQGKRRPPEVA